MATHCAYCDQVMWAGVQHQGMRFCGKKCQRGALSLIGDRPILPELVEQEVDRVRHSSCPRCAAPGPIDVYESHRVLSLIIVTSWSSHQHLCCPACARHAIRQDLLFSLLAGWWGFPFGLIMTPVQLLRNIAGTPNSSVPPKKPSLRLRKLVQAQLWQANLESAKQGSKMPISYSNPLLSVDESPLQVARSLESSTATADPAKVSDNFVEQADSRFRRQNGLPLLLRIILMGLPGLFLIANFAKLGSFSILGFLGAIAIVCPWLEDKIQEQIPQLKSDWARGLVWVISFLIGVAGLPPSG